MRRSTRLIAFAVIMAAAAFFRLYRLAETPPGLFMDEAMNGNNAAEALASGEFKVFYPENNGREGLFINIQAISLLLFGNEPWALRLPSALFGIGTVAGIYFLTRELFRVRKKREAAEDDFPEIAALASAFIAAVSFWHVNFSRIGFRAITAPLFLVWAMFFLLAAWRRADAGDGGPEKRRFPTTAVVLAVLGGASYGLGFHSYIAYRATPLLLAAAAAIIIKEAVQRKAGKRATACLAAFCLSALIAAAPLAAYFIGKPSDFWGRVGQISVFSTPHPVARLLGNVVLTAGMFNVLGDLSWRHNHSGRPQLETAVGLFFLAGLLLLAVGLRRKAPKKPDDAERIPVAPPRAGFILFTWLAAALIPAALSGENQPHALRALLAAPPAFIAAGYGAAWLYAMTIRLLASRPAGKTALTALALFILPLVLSLQTMRTYFVDWAARPETAEAFMEKYADIGRRLKSLPPEIPKFVVVKKGRDRIDPRMLIQPIMFITDTYTAEKQSRKNIKYVLPGEPAPDGKRGIVITVD